MTAQKRSALLATVVLVLSLFAGAGAASADTTDVSPPGANDWACTPSSAHPYPVVLVPGTFENMAKNWSTLSPVLKSQGYCVFALNYGEVNGVYASGPIADSARELAPFVDAVLAATGARQVDLVGHSQGGMMPRYYMGFLGGAKKVHHLVGISPSNHGTQGLIVPPPDSTPSEMQLFSPFCQACMDQQAGSAFLTKLNSIGDTVHGPLYTVISTTHDEVVTPYQSQSLAGSSAQVTNITIQDACPLDLIEHDQTPNDPVVHQWVMNALSQQDSPADPAFRPVCL
ncbi:alpha/beta fold hydrolase [Arthrobacter sp. AZCC_0090]|uniref:lipase family alpha/beta hydrolase n=1 Tax=Arthrobacter sp. AZCC_0090 TaxID=2735881 RepID=UPI001621E5C4|nr:alpha/beta fold hydrolase [Arthrobacter sp. AZCC_0090]MBB6403449.1 triacylglycerol lipase [Arthrobacter sp. AZCC_0090]